MTGLHRCKHRLRILSDGQSMHFSTKISMRQSDHPPSSRCSATSTCRDVQTTLGERKFVSCNSAESTTLPLGLNFTISMLRSPQYVRHPTWVDLIRYPSCSRVEITRLALVISRSQFHLYHSSIPSSTSRSTNWWRDTLFCICGLCMIMLTRKLPTEMNCTI